MKKKLLTLAMAAIMVLGLSTTAFAAEVDDEETTTVVTDSAAPVVKVVTGKNAPEETYTFTVTAKEMSNTPSSVTTQPTIPSVTITTSTTEGESSQALDLSAITQIGIYTYTIAETSGKTAGISYDTTTYTLKVTAYLDADGSLKKDIAITDSNGNKVENAKFENTYTANTLTVTKKVTGNLGDTTKEFSFTVTFTNSNSETVEWVNNIAATASGVVVTVGTNNTYTFTLKDGASATFSNIPSGISYSVTENDENTDGYTTTYDSNKEGKMAGSDVSTTVTNDKNQAVDTGINLDSLPYVLILSLVLIGAAYVIFRRRLSDRY